MHVGSERLLKAFSVLFLCYQYCENRYIWSSEICLFVYTCIMLCLLGLARNADKMLI